VTVAVRHAIRTWRRGMTRIALCAAGLVLTLASPALADMEHEAPMMPRRPLGLSMNRSGSGTSWQPDTTPMYAWQSTLGDWTFMLHGNAFLGLDAQGSRRGAFARVNENWLMGMARRSSSSVEVEMRAMVSAEPLLMGGAGYPLLLQTGETYRGAPLHDWQHPHDFFMETSLTLTAAAGRDVAFQLYLAPAGEPALGPNTYVHRASAASNPFAPLGHHWQDVSHITYGVVTAGFFTPNVKLEASWFNGREPDENRFDFDLRVPDSYSVRLTVNPIDALSLQASYGWLKSPEADRPEVSVRRATASASLDLPFGERGNLATTAVWGANFPSAMEPATTSMLVEAEANLDGHHTVFGRWERIQKTGHALVLPETEANRVFDIRTISVGYVREYGPIASLLPGIGVVGTMNMLDRELGAHYGTTWPLGGMVFLRLRPAQMARHLM
jgi:hypothetical protein